MPWFDAHLDLAYLAEIGRDMHAHPADCRGRLQPAAVTLPSLREGAVTACLGTIFTEAIGPDAPDEGPYAYRASDAEAARRAGLRQLKLYHAWRDAGAIELLARRSARQPAARAPLRVGILMECADPIISPDDLDEWVSAGVICIGMTWASGSRYAGGNATGGGLTDLGRALAQRMDELGVVHDVSHLSQRALDDLLELTGATVVASHSNCRALLDGVNERHLSDGAIREIARRGGVIGLNLCSAFLATGLWDRGRATIDDCVRHIERICELAGDRRHIGLGSDMDGGFAADRLPVGVDRPRDLERLADALGACGWSESDLQELRWGAWAQFWGL
ncbi:MAG: dipeptidase [Phycisphaerales bacterium JB039]